LIIYASTITNRLRYISDHIGKECYGKIFQITDNLEAFLSAASPKINYSKERITDEEIWIVPHPLLFETSITEQKIEVSQVNGRPCIFPTEGDLGFDILAASFYLLSRYEEYLPHDKDEHGRYSHKNSAAFKNGFLQRPLVNEWIDLLRSKLLERSPSLALPKKKFEFIPTYDIDEAWSFRNKPFMRSMGGKIRDLLKGDLKRVRARSRVLHGKVIDPYDSYDWMDELHHFVPHLKPRYFFHVAARNGKYDKNNLPGEREMRKLINRMVSRYDIGVHPSWQSGDHPGLLKQETMTLQRISARKINSSRQHFIRFWLPQSFRRLIEAGVTDDYSMGYGTVNGFRASTSTAFYWYDLEKEETTLLLLHPFCFMEANSFFEQKYTPEQALEEMIYYREVIRAVNGTMITIWHNTFLGTDPLFQGWREVYQKFVMGA